MEYIIQNKLLQIQISDYGAELQSIKNINDGVEYLWQGDPQLWPDRSPVIFPYVGRLTESRYEYQGKQYFMPIHGFAPTSYFDVLDHQEQSVSFCLSSNPQTLSQYPFEFELWVTYTLENNKLTVTYQVTNRGSSTMYFGLGGHPGFRIPLESGLDFEDYQLTFSSICDPVRIGFTDSVFLSGNNYPFPLENGTTLHLSHELFNEDAIILKGTSQTLMLHSSGGDRKIVLFNPNMPYLGFWQVPKSNAQFLCVEPWSSLPSRQGVIEDIQKQPDLLSLAAGETYQTYWSASFF